MRTLTILLVTLVVLTALSAAQLRQQSPLQPGRPVPGTEIPVEGVVHWVVNPAFAPRSLEELVKEADVIVDGVVESQLPSRLEDPRQPTSIETDVILEVTNVLKGRSQDL